MRNKKTGAPNNVQNDAENIVEHEIDIEVLEMFLQDEPTVNQESSPSELIPSCPICGLLLSPVGTSYYVCDDCGYRRGRADYCTCKYPQRLIRGLSFIVEGESGSVCMRCLLPFELVF
ncbi:MAG: hypothetical protein KatS3mg087_1536 [Patescibacteria group bacterium]|nr:MAG: hypothetical protein KatS3mg087_1536 [Patescibacteria group bacterium]